MDSPIGLAFPKEFPAPRDAARLTEKRLARFLAAHSYSGRRKADELLGRLRDAPVGLAGAAEEASKRTRVLGLVAVLRLLVQQVAELTSALEHDVAQLAGGRIVLSFPRVGKVNAAQILAELGDERSRFTAIRPLQRCGGGRPDPPPRLGWGTSHRVSHRSWTSTFGGRTATGKSSLPPGGGSRSSASTSTPRSCVLYRTSHPSALNMNSLRPWGLVQA